MVSLKKKLEGCNDSRRGLFMPKYRDDYNLTELLVNTTEWEIWRRLGVSTRR